MNQPAFQDQMRDNHCWGCGSLNEHGFQIKSRWQGDEAVCAWQPDPAHAAGPRHILNGGVIATIIDCHGVCTAIAAAYRAEGRALDSEPMIWYATGTLTVNYLKPTPIDRPVELRARVEEVLGKKTRVSCTLTSQGEVCATGEVLAVRVPSGWREG